MELREAIIHAKQVAEGCPAGSDCAYQHDELVEWLEELSALKQAQTEGLLLVLPCKAGDAAWYITSLREVCDAEVIGISLNVYTNPQMWLEIKYYSKVTGEHDYKSRIDLMLGKTTFLALAEAEAALEVRYETNPV